MEPNTTALSDAFTHHLRVLNTEEGPKPTADGTILRSSDAGKCARQIGFGALGFDKDYDYSDTTLRKFLVGNWWHETLQGAVLVPQWGGEAEFTVTYRDVGLSLSGDADGVYTMKNDVSPFPAKVVLEIKSSAPYGYWLQKRAAGSKTWKPKAGVIPGPKLDYIKQAGTYALAPQVQAEYIHIVVVNKADEGEWAEWLIGVDEPLDFADGRTVRNIVNTELSRLADIEEQVRAGVLPAPIHPEDGLIEDPPAHDTEGGKGQPWYCRFCDFNATCRGLGTEALQTDMSPLDRFDVIDAPIEEAA